MTPLDEATLASLCCPRCKGPLGDDETDVACRGCGAAYPAVGRIPCLVVDPSLWRARWLARFREYFAATERRILELEQEATLPHLLDRIRERILRAAGALRLQRDRIHEHAAALGQTDPRAAAAIPTQQAGAGRTVLKCYENLFRDWNWGDEENELTLSLVAEMAPEPIGRLAVYGAGAARLAADVHGRLHPLRTFALDINPLPLLIAEAVIRGERVTLPEFPVGPHSDRHWGVDRKLACPAAPGSGFQLLFADALAPPFGPGSLDAVLTSWFIDAVEADFRTTLGAIHDVLRPGGVWIHLGPLRFDGPLSSVYMIEDVLEIAERNGFEKLSVAEHTVPYFDSPIAGSRRLETVFALSARKVGQRQATPVGSILPSWLGDPSLPIPLSPDLARSRKASVFTAGVLAMVDGSRSLSDIAGVLATEWRMEAATLLPELQVFFERQWRS